jgi:MoaA/NifB/PqqE/SkfB family radical SAM enzyme
MYKTEKEKVDHMKRLFLKSRKLGIVSITKRCNMSCTYCRGKLDNWYDVLSQKTINLDLERNNFKKLVKIFKKHDFAEVLLTGGEPLEYPYFKELILFLNINKIIFSIHTNGFSKNWNSILAVLKKHNIKPNIHLSSELFLNLQRNIRRTKQLPIKFVKQVTAQGIGIELKVTLHKRMMAHIERLEDSLLAWQCAGVKSIRFQPVVSTSEYFLHNLTLDESVVPLFEKLIDIKNNNKKLGEIIRNSVDSFRTTISYLKKTDYYKKTAKKCDMKNRIVFIDADLRLKNCMSLWGKDLRKKCENVFDLICCGFQ